MDKERLSELLGEISLMDYCAEAFRRGDFTFIVQGKNEDGKTVEHKKQRNALEILTSNMYEEFLYGGAAGGAKTWTGCAWLIFMCYNHPNIRCFVARKELKDIISSVFVTFKKVARKYGFDDFKFNSLKNYIKFDNGSQIDFIEVKYKPSDTMYEDLGSMEYTIGWIEEVGEIHEMAATVLSSRVGRHLNSKYGIGATVFYTGNPKKNWSKLQFYDKWKRGALEKQKMYLPCLLTENPFIERSYIDKMRRLAEKNKALYERLFKGNWEYEDSDDMLCDYEMVTQIFVNDHVPEGKKYITADIARFGEDKAVIFVWSGWQIIDYVVYDTCDLNKIQATINLLRQKYGVPRNQAVADEDGVGGGVVDNCKIEGFMNNAKPMKENNEDVNYRNLQVQCLYKLAEKINEGKIWIKCDLSGKEKQQIIEELDQIRSRVSDYGKLDLKPKSEIKQDIGRSPDFRDAMLMRMVFEFKKPRRRIAYGRSTNYR